MTVKDACRVVLIVQARMSSTRLPGKVLKEVLGRPLLLYLIERLQKVRLSDELVIATSTDPSDDPIVDLCVAQGVSVHRGPLDDVLARYAGAARESRADAIVRICSDCVLIDPSVIDESIHFYLKQDPMCDWVGNMVERRYPRGYEVEVFSRRALDIAEREATASEEREHVTPYLYWNPEIFRLGSVVGKCDLGTFRWVLDTAEDLKLITHLLEALYPSCPNFHTEDIVRLLEKHPEWVAFNAHVQQKPLRGMPEEEA